MLPIGPPGPRNSPYAARSAFAGDPMLISVDRLVEDGHLDAAPPPPLASGSRVDFQSRRAYKEPLLRAATARFLDQGGEAELRSFEAAHPWLETYATYAALRDATGEPWWHWDEPLRTPAGVNIEPGSPLAREVLHHKVLQVLFARQWERLHNYARRRGVALWGDLPIFVDRDSADAWAHQEMYKLDEHGDPVVVSGVPPDAFSETGQRWGNPVYDWDALERDGFRWWVERLRATFERFDAVRIDHFRGFESAWEIPAGEETAIHGRWVPGPGERLFAALEARTPKSTGHGGEGAIATWRFARSMLW